MSSVREWGIFSPGMERAWREYTYPPPHTYNTRTHPLTRHAQIKTGDLESINVLTNPQLQHRVMIQTTSTPLIFRLFSQLFFFSRTQLTIKVFFSMSSDFSQIMNGEKKNRKEGRSNRKKILHHAFFSLRFFRSGVYYDC